MAKLTLSTIASGYGSVDTLNANFAAIVTALENTLSRDGTTPNTMSANLDMNGYRILNAVASGGDENFTWLGAWTTATLYSVNNLVSNGGSSYICIVEHTSGTFATDLAASKWTLLASKGDTGASGDGSGDMVAANNLSDVANATTARGNLSAAKSGANSDITSLQSSCTVTTQSASDNSTKIASTAYVNTAVSAAAGIPAGVMLEYAGSGAVPSGYLLCDGTAVSRTTYATLFAAISTTWGVGNGTTTFNLPDTRRRVAVGSGGSGTATLDDLVGSTGGAETHTLTQEELPTVVGTLNRNGTPTTGFDNSGIAVESFDGNNNGPVDIVNADGGDSHNNMQPSYVVQKIIKY